MGDTTRRLREAAQRTGATDPARTPAALPEHQVRIHCAGKTAAQVLDEMQHGLVESLALQKDPLIVLEELSLLQDSITSLIKGLSRTVVGFPRPVTFWESSGFAETFMSVIDTPQRFKHTDPPA